jgi:hypothetical protein
MIAYNADAAWLYGTAVRLPAATYNPQEDFFEVYDFDSGRYIGKIPQAEQTYNVVCGV